MFSCRKCGEPKPETDFYKKKGVKRGHMAWCKPCWKAEVRRREDPEKARERSRLWREQYPERAKANVKAWMQAHPMKNAEYQQRRREREWAAFVERVDPRVVYERDGGNCGICGNGVSFIEMTIDHIIPFSRGGEHSYANVQVAHLSCNRKKGSSMPDSREIVPAGG